MQAVQGLPSVLTTSHLPEGTGRDSLVCILSVIFQQTYNHLLRDRLSGQNQTCLLPGLEAPLRASAFFLVSEVGD